MNNMGIHTDVQNLPHTTQHQLREDADTTFGSERVPPFP
jgi:hypothetical protein